MSYERVFVRVLYGLSINYFLNLKVTFNVKFTPFTYPRLYQLVDQRIGMKYFSKKLGVDGFLYDRLLLKHAQPYLDWQKEFEVVKETVRNIDACSLLKSEPRSRAFDVIGPKGDRECFEQCKMENKVYYEYLNSKLQKLIRMTSYNVEVRLTEFPVADSGNSTPKNFYKCAKKGYKRYVCECTYSKYVVEATDQFKETFHQIIEDLYGLSPSPNSCKMLEERYRIPLKLIAFLIYCHLLPTDIFTFLVWWNSVEDASSHPTAATASDEESESSIFGTKTEKMENEETEETMSGKEQKNEEKNFGSLNTL